MSPGHNGCLCGLDPSVPYEGPRASIATLGGSPTWGLGDRFHELAAAQGHARLGLHRPRTPYGLGPQVEHYRTPRGREFLRIPTYGQVVDEDPLLRGSEWKTFWILWQAGVRVLLVGGTSGSCDWRRGAGDEDAVRPGDLVLPQSYLPRDTMPTGLPGTELEFCLPRQVAIMDDPFCPVLAEAIREDARRLPGASFRRIHGPESRVVLNRWLAGNGFESLASCRELELYGRLTGMPVITGDCVSPVLARVCGMHLGYYHVVANWGTGLEPEDPTITLDRLYLETLPRVAATLELMLLDRVGEPDTCRCRALLRPRPPEYVRALSPGREPPPARATAPLPWGRPGAARPRRRGLLGSSGDQTPGVGPSVPASPLGRGPLPSLAVLLLAALVLFTARIGDLSLPSLEDAFYAREAVEMARAGRIYTVTWNGIPTHQHPPLHLWLVSLTFSVLGERDLAARLPTVLLALGTLALTWRIGVLTLGPASAIVGTACLLATPIFADNARRLMMEVPLTFWVAATVWMFLEARGRPRWHLALAIPLGAAILTKSVLGLLPLLALSGTLASDELRAPLRRPWVWIGVGLGLALGATWPVHQWWTQGPDAVASHFLGHVVRRSTRGFGLSVLREYPVILLKFYQPIVLPALVGLWLVLRRPGPLRGRGVVLAAWIVLPVVLYSLSSFRTPRFLLPIVPALALAAGHALVTVVPRVAALLVAPLVPAGAVAVALLFWWNPSLLTRDANAVFKRNAATIRELAPPGESVPYLGNHYWASANPLLYYAERHLAASSPSGTEAVETARRHGGRLLLVTRRRLPDVAAVGAPHRVLLEGRDWVLLRVPRPGDGPS